jgi:hypothetical protein
MTFSVQNFLELIGELLDFELEHLYLPAQLVIGAGLYSKPGIVLFDIDLLLALLA